MKDYKLSKYVEKVFETPSSGVSEWFGYYNYDPLTSDHSKLLCNRIKEDGIPPRADMSIEVGYYDIETSKWHHIGFSDSWNWQQGCMAQWINDEEVIYNTSRDNHHIAVIHNIKTQENREIDWAIYAIMPNGKKSISLSMERAHWCRAYHYQSVADDKYDGAIYENDGVFEIDLEKNTRRKIISIQDIISLDRRDYFEKAKHWLEHIMINQAGTKFCFLHRFSPIDNIYKYCTRLIIVDIPTMSMQCIPGWEKMQWSHFGWNGDDFAIYSYPLKGEGVSSKDFDLGQQKVIINPVKAVDFGIKSVVKKVVRNITNAILPLTLERKLRNKLTYYQYYKCINGKYELQYFIDNKAFLIDGHPSFIPEGGIMITDTYPDNKHVQRLYKYYKNGRIELLGKFNAFYHNNPASCDLHPKLSKDGTHVVVDSAHDIRHHMIVLKFKDKV